MQVSFTVCYDCCSSGATPLAPHGDYSEAHLLHCWISLEPVYAQMASCTVLLLKSEINACTSGETCIQARKYAFPIQFSALNYQCTDEGTAWICAWHYCPCCSELRGADVQPNTFYHPNVTHMRLCTRLSLLFSRAQKKKTTFLCTF